MGKKMIGTVLPTKESLKATETWAINEAKKARKIAEKEGLDKLFQTKSCGEIRYWRNEKEYAIVSKTGKVLWFEVRKDGEYSI